MAKTIKFNLICEDKPIRTIEDLQDNFSIEDVLEYFNNKLLHRWLCVRGYDKELTEVNSITDNEPIEIIKKLISIFNVVSDEKKINESIYMLEYLDERKERNSIYEKENSKIHSIIDDYQTGYMQLVDDIISNPNDISKIKANVVEITKNYMWVFELNHRELFYCLLKKSPLAIFVLLTNYKTREAYLPISLVESNQTVQSEQKTEVHFLHIFHTGPYINSANLEVEKTTKYDIDLPEYSDKKYMYNKVCELLTETKLKENLGENLKEFSGITDGYWKDLEPKGKEYMILSMGNGDFVRSSGKSGGDLSYNDINNQFVIVNGIDYKSNSATRKLLYMEV